MARGRATSRRLRRCVILPLEAAGSCMAATRAVLQERCFAAAASRKCRKPAVHCRARRGGKGRSEARRGAAAAATTAARGARSRRAKLARGQRESARVTREARATSSCIARGGSVQALPRARRTLSAAPSHLCRTYFCRRLRALELCICAICAWTRATCSAEGGPGGASHGHRHGRSHGLLVGVRFMRSRRMGGSVGAVSD